MSEHQGVSTPHRVRFADKEKRTVAMTHDVYTRLVAVAERERRSISSQIEVLIEEGLDHRDAGTCGVPPRRGKTK